MPVILAPGRAGANQVHFTLEASLWMIYWEPFAICASDPAMPFRG